MTKTMSKGAAALREATAPAEPPRYTQARLAEELGISQQAVSAWVAGKARPAPEMMLRLERLLGIPMAAWLEESEPEPRAVLRPRRAAVGGLRCTGVGPKRRRWREPRTRRSRRSERPASPAARRPSSSTPWRQDVRMFVAVRRLCGAEERGVVA